jgi:hypothetical protein
LAKKRILRVRGTVKPLGHVSARANGDIQRVVSSNGIRIDDLGLINAKAIATFDKVFNNEGYEQAGEREL